MACGESVGIRMRDDGGYTYNVQRLPARELQRGNFVLVETDNGDPRAYRSRKVMDVCPSVSKPGKWEVAVEKDTRVKVEPDCYYNCSA